MNEHKAALAVVPSGHTLPPLLPQQRTSELTVGQWSRNVQNHCDRTGTQNKTTLLRKRVTLNTAHAQLSLGLDTPPGALPVPSYCHLLVPARGWSPTFWMSASRLGDVPGGREGCPGHKEQAGLSHHRACHGCPQAPVARLPLLGTTAALHPRRPLGLSKSTAAPGLSRPSIPSKSRDVYRIRPHSLHIKTALPLQRWEGSGATPQPTRGASAGAGSRRHLSPSVRPAGWGRKGFMEPGDSATY